MAALARSAEIIGYIVMVAGGFAIAGLLLFLAATVAGKYAWRTFDSLSSIYRLESISYWFARLDKNGYALRKEFERAAPPPKENT